jgi:hypothetical protein
VVLMALRAVCGYGCHGLYTIGQLGLHPRPAAGRSRTTVSAGSWPAWHQHIELLPRPGPRRAAERTLRAAS